LGPLGSFLNGGECQFYYLATTTTITHWPQNLVSSQESSRCCDGTQEDVYQAYIATCQAKGWPTRYMHQMLGKVVKCIFPLVSTQHHCIKQYYMGLCPQLQQQVQLCCLSTSSTNNNNHCGDCCVDGLQCYLSSLLLWWWYAQLQAAPAV
jgi:hypothetical protein